MGKKYRNLIGPITAPDNLRAAYRLAARGKRMTPSYLQFKEYAEVHLDELAEEMAAGTYRPAPPRTFTVFEPKPRQIEALSFRDRVAQHALVGVIGPIFEATFLPRTFACRPGLGVHAGVKVLQSDMRRMGEPLYALKTDFSKYFHSIDRSVLHGLIRKKISCRATLGLVDAITPPGGKGIPIGSLTSQLYANLYGAQVDQYLQFDRGVKMWVRYMDDIVILGRDPAGLRALSADMAAFAQDRLGLRFSKWSVQPISRGVNFLGYRIWPTHKLLRRQSVTRARRVISHLSARGDHGRLNRFLAAWLGHARWADSHNLLRSLSLEYADVAA